MKNLLIETNRAVSEIMEADDKKKDKDMDIILDQLSNNETDSDEELIKHLSTQVKSYSPKQIKDIVKRERDNFLTGKYYNKKTADLKTILKAGLDTSK